MHRVLAAVAAANLTYFFIEFAVARAIGSVSLFADSIDFLEDASVNALVLLALGWTLAARARMGMALALLLLLPAAAALWTAWAKFQTPVAPHALLLGAAGLGALAINLSCATLLAAYRKTGGSLAKAAFLSARNDAIANIAIVAAGVVTATLWHSAWPDLLTGLGIAAMNAGAAREVWEAARHEQAAASA